jgi:SAM-dependent methyltransferase
LTEGVPSPFLIALGVMNAEGKVYAKFYDKFRQINRYLETVADIIPSFTNGNEGHVLRIIDFGCGKAYLTFALYHYLVDRLKLTVQLIGLDLKEDLINRSNALARTLGCSNLHFIVGDVRNYHTQETVDMVISLHACDTATDVALAKAVDWKSRVILAVPCCQHELRDKIQNPSLKLLLKHGILRERFAAMATDAMRAQLLETCGYHTQVIEFIDMEHTAKNLLIRAVKKEGNVRPEIAADYQAFRAMIGDTGPLLETLL